MQYFDSEGGNGQLYIRFPRCLLKQSWANSLPIGSVTSHRQLWKINVHFPAADIVTTCFLEGSHYNIAERVFVLAIGDAFAAARLNLPIQCLICEYNAWTADAMLDLPIQCLTCSCQYNGCSKSIWHMIHTGSTSCRCIQPPLFPTAAVTKNMPVYIMTRLDHVSAVSCLANIVQ